MNATFVRQTQGEHLQSSAFSRPANTPPHPRMDDQMVRPNECAMISSEAF